jgi:serine/threonine-protein kinase
VTSPSTTPGRTLPRPETRAAVQPGRVLAGCRLEAVVGQGAFSTVFAARDVGTDAPLVVKVLAAEAPPPVVERFRREVVFARRLSHPGFGRIHALVEEATDDGPVLALTMERIDGRTLGDVMNEGPMAPARAVAVGRALAAVVAVAHAAGVVHGDLKPGNVLLRRTPRVVGPDHPDRSVPDVVVIDFGAATAVDVPACAERFGSVHYLAPELFTDERPTPAVDVWSIGVILYGCLTGRFPFDGPDERAIAEAARAGRPPPPSSLRLGVPRVVDDVVQRALTPSRRVRPADAAALADLLTQAASTLSLPSLPSSSSSSRRWGGRRGR